ncbi:MAG: tRNA uridine-5-carboxymethylaminomethyl(34) synthesis GTPase MnmE [Lachnospiraceae bacterium]|nr:tRNA uridine-5-carboxymethylaminomethyl(34) synthesis GTPase MnmE [Lachnospiraceae bacterium]
MITDTIAAIATGMTSAGIGIIRISGADAFAIADKIFTSYSGDKVCEFKTHTIHLGNIMKDGHPLDEVLLSVMRGPHSYTGEDVVEINAHGGMYLCNAILETVFDAGAVPAEPGEFTKRAFLNGKMDLTQAEAVMDLISSKNEYAVKNSMEHLSGRLRNKINDLRERILYETAYIESALDDPEHFDLTDYPEELDVKVNAMLDEIERMIELSKSGRIRKDGIRTAIIGKPNAGKSSILNMLSGKETAIVTDIPGTTRDSIEESVRLGELQLNLTDTAGIREADDEVERIGVERALKISADADLILFVVDSSIALDDNDKKIMDIIKGKNVVVLFNKTDLDTVVSPDDILRILGNVPLVEFSKNDDESDKRLEEVLKEVFINKDTALNDESVMTNSRQLRELKMAQQSLMNVLRSIENFMTEDFFSIDLTDAYKHLGFIIGEEIDDDLADMIFSRFCMGK